MTLEEAFEHFDEVRDWVRYKPLHANKPLLVKEVVSASQSIADLKRPMGPSANAAASPI